MKTFPAQMNLKFSVRVRNNGAPALARDRDILNCAIYRGARRVSSDRINGIDFYETSDAETRNSLARARDIVIEN